MSRRVAFKASELQGI